MKYFTVYANQNQPSELKLVPEGFSWLVFILGPVGLFVQKSWIHGLILLSVCFSLIIWIHPSFFLMALVHFIVGCFAFHFQRTELQWAGWNLQTVIAAPNKKFALLRLLDKKHRLTNYINS